MEYEHTLAALIADLAKGDPRVRAQARELLAQRGTDAVTLLLQALESPTTFVRWEAAKTLSMMGDAAATDALIRALDDSNRPVAWLAAKGLIAIGSSCVPTLLHNLIAQNNNSNILKGAHHVLHELCDDTLRPVVAALEGSLPSLEAPLAAYHALDKLRR